MKKLVLLATAILLAGVFWGCGGGGSGGSPTQVNANLIGQLVMPVPVDLPKYEVYLDNDQDLTNGFVLKDSGVCLCRDLVDYFFVDAPAGTYFLYAVVRINSADGAAPVSGDYIGIYSADGNPPSAANVVVVPTGVQDLLINMATLVTP